MDHKKFFNLQKYIKNILPNTVDTRKIATVIIRNIVKIAYFHEYRIFFKFEKMRNIKKSRFLKISNFHHIKSYWSSR